ncbi:hypothetical protein O181_052806 [Austropuccinia psidii MF-1]|uniref:G3BP-like protein n=1 Tax=Austropuccinia psidii MF-1 TaxID=1389203 RepID=A0A9Q3DZ82_9BASI|nr:hypothetical protein [Austropuccinia psidii MF-1]
MANANNTSVAKSAQNANDIGWAFVPQYYTFVNKDPSRLHCFYTKRSTLIHSTEGEEATPCFGQQEIHEKFMSLNFDDCKVFVSNVDSQSSADGGIIVQVLGEMSNEAGPWRKFAQTFFLAEQPNGFFVLNDIFRYMKEDDEVEEEPEPEPVTVTEDIPVSDHSLIPSGPDNHSAPTNRLPVATEPSIKAPSESADLAAASVNTTVPSSRVMEAVPSPSQPTQTSQVNGFHTESREAKPTEPTPEPNRTASKINQPAPPPESTALGAAALSAPSAVTSVASSTISAQEPSRPKLETSASVTPSASSVTPSANGRPVNPQSKPTSSASGPSAGLTKNDAPQSTTPKTWASLAASGKSAWGQGHLSLSQGVSSAPSPASQPATDPQPSQPQHRQTGSAAQHSNADRYLSVDSIATGSCFIKSVNENIDEKSLKDQLVKKFGPIKELDIVRNKACGFLEFERIESAKKAIQMSMPFNLGGKGGIPIVIGSEEYVINIESKRLPGERGRPMDAGPKRGFGERGGRTGGNNYGGGGSSGGGRGRSGMDNGPRGSGRGGGGGVVRGGGRGLPHSNK